MTRLLLDLDGKWSGCKWGRWCDDAHDVLVAADVTPHHVDVIDTRHGLHAHVDLVDDLPPLAIAALQAALGSDGKREANGVRRILAGQDEWNMLFVRKHYPDGSSHQTTRNIPYARRLQNALRRTWPVTVRYIDAGAERAI